MAFEEYFNSDGIFAENDLYILKRLCGADKEPFMRLQTEASEKAGAVNIKEFNEYLWESSLSDEDTLILSLLGKSTGDYIGRLTVQNPYSEKPEIGCDIAKEFRRQGIAFSAIKLLMTRIREFRNIEAFELKAYADNIPSINLIQKLGGIEVGREENDFLAVLSKGARMCGYDIFEGDNGIDREALKAYEKKYIRVFEVRAE